MPGLLCIGGPFAGRRVETRNGHPRFIASEPDGIGGEARWRQVIYVLQDWHTSDGKRLQFWTPSGQTADQTMQMLALAYEAHIGHPPETIKP